MSSPSGKEHDAWSLQAAFRRWRERAGRNVDLALCDPLEKEQIARDIGVSPDELNQLAKAQSTAADLLQERMAALDLDPNEVARTSPETMRDMQRLCTLCKKQRRCARDLARHASDPVWKEYCPNLEALTSLDTMPWAARSEW
jgi:hypothetical protein